LKKETSKKNSYRRLCLILGDQLNLEHSWFQHNDSETLFVIAELHQEATYVKQHIQKLCAFFSAMEHFAKGLTTRPSYSSSHAG
jgi:deoxyribodipyrimidine photolyase-related protein